VPRLYTMDNDFQLSYEARKEGNFSGEPGEDWRLLGTDADPVIQEAYGIEP